tara:strand:- start:508 stop:816 length:309 start_codon:yes stop_codon:yes gene_type:complete
MIGTHKTTTRTNDNNELIVCYHSTEVVKVINNRYVVLKSGGWLTPTTKRRMNQASEQYRLNYLVYQKGFVWYVKTPQVISEYYDGIVIDIKEGTVSKQLKLN